MATAQENSTIDQIGETAGMVWQLLNTNGALSITRVVRELDVPRDVVLQAIGWLAREHKISIDESPRSKLISLR